MIDYGCCLHCDPQCDDTQRHDIPCGTCEKAKWVAAVRAVFLADQGMAA